MVTLEATIMVSILLYISLIDSCWENFLDVIWLNVLCSFPRTIYSPNKSSSLTAKSYLRESSSWMFIPQYHYSPSDGVKENDFLNCHLVPAHHSREHFHFPNTHFWSCIMCIVTIHSQLNLISVDSATVTPCNIYTLIDSDNVE